MLYWAGTTWANEMNFVMNHATGAGSIARPVDQLSSVMPLYHGCTKMRQTTTNLSSRTVLCCVVSLLLYRVELSLYMM